MTGGSVTRAAAGRSGALLVALLLVALNLRGHITAPAPVLQEIATALSLSPGEAGWLTGLPVLCFATLTPLAAVAIARAGTTRMLAGALLAILLGTLLRSFGGTTGAFAGTVVIGAAVTVGNIAVPTVIARDFPSRAPRVMGLYSALMTGGAGLTTVGTAPLAALVGWRWALVAWGVLVVVALAVWVRVTGGRADSLGAVMQPGEAPSVEPLVPPRSVLRRPVAWLLCAAFVGQSASYMGLTAWLPSVLREEAGLGPAAAGAAASTFQLVGFVGSLALPAALAWRAPPRAVTVVVAACWLSLPLGLLLAPGGWAVWAALAGLAQAANFVLIFSVVTAVAGSPAGVRRLSAAVQTVGYLVAALTPSLLGTLRSATGSWSVPLLVVTGLLTLMAVTLTIASGRLRRPA